MSKLQSVSKTYLSLVANGELDDSGNQMKRTQRFQIHPYNDERILRAFKQDEEKVRIEPNCYIKFKSFFMDKRNQTLQVEASAALMEHIRHQYFEQLMLADKAYFYFPVGYEPDLDGKKFIGKWNDIQNAMTKTKLAFKPCKQGIKNERNRVVKFYPEGTVSCYEVNRIKSLSYLQKLVLKEIYMLVTSHAGRLTSVRKSKGHRAIKAMVELRSTPELRFKWKDAKRELQMDWADNQIRGAQYLYEQLYFSIEDFVELE